jgi:hypothetical protein
MPSGLPGLSSIQKNFRQFKQDRLSILHFVFEFPHATYDLVGWNAVGIGREYTHELRAPAGNDESLEAVCAQIRQQLQHRLINQLIVRTVEPWSPGGLKPVTHNLVELGGGHAGVRARHDFQQTLLARREQSLSITG